MPAKTKAAAARPSTTRQASGTAAVKSTTKPTTKAAKATTRTAASKKRKAEEEASAEPEPRAKKRAHVETGKKINDAPTQVLDIYVFGEGSSGELGLGSGRINGKRPIDVKRPRLNDKLSAKSVGVVQIACGGMHAVALTRDHRILTWGVNDQGALGRDTAWEGNLRDADKDEGSDSGSDDDDSGINPLESTPTALSDDASFALTEDGRVYGWGTFRSSDGVLGFTEKIRVQETPVLLPTLKNIKALSAGSNHILALDHKGYVLAWGCGQQNQLGRRIIERNKLSSLIPQGIGLPRGKIVKVACGSYHSFALDKDGNVWGWGLNNFGEIGAEGNAGEDDAVILKPAKVEFLDKYEVTGIDGGVHHSVACTDKGELLTWGRVDGFQIGFEPDQLKKDDVLFDERGDPRILIRPTPHAGVSKVASVSAGTDNSFAVTDDGKVYSWGFSANYQTGQGTIEDIHTPTLVDNSAIRDKKILAAYAGGQFSILIAAAEGKPKTNGVNGQ
ncbi:regulator of chromosome condensation (RCC1) repeat domain-containing protein [Hirsutella rhossiliensis]|uniref:Regulator of chromosome condensation (RCC1) repeat domain-containing protein n=1 Tax=Hirsutella rhossiliensis TaxID=111463 RepID=A0A9P8MW38_9HYPO|nr:regulator of chromosome condensation (RCC1) repeat domain-containing protein [Hirsutella rhossiliensis]KAH0961469.1 regulator of chromosome condensation (RCC1) repeat domain-containing protein [Hirsutella rhossiliensis]